MRPSEQCQQHGLTLNEFIALTEVPKRTLLTWHKTKQNVFKLLLVGAVAKKNGEV